MGKVSGQDVYYWGWIRSRRQSPGQRGEEEGGTERQESENGRQDGIMMKVKDALTNLLVVKSFHIMYVHQIITLYTSNFHSVIYPFF